MIGLKGRIWLVTLFLLGNGGIIWAQASLPTQPSPRRMLYSPAFQPWEKPPVSFSHQQHEAQQIACRVCHHQYEQGRNRWQQGDAVQNCEACHQVQPQAEQLDLKNAFHRQCKGCHLQRRRQGMAGGPIRCQDCHRQT